jgi:hypothetical protein
VDAEGEVSAVKKLAAEVPMNTDEMKKRADEALVRCYACGSRASCHGQHDGHEGTEYCCAVCCGGEERCVRLKDVDDQALAVAVLELIAENERLRGVMAANEKAMADASAQAEHNTARGIAIRERKLGA